MDKKIINELNEKYPFSNIQNFFGSITKEGDESQWIMSEIIEMAKSSGNIGLLVAELINEKNFQNSDIKIISNLEVLPENNINIKPANKQMAKIYLNQGMKEEAIKIYKRISLDNKKNSTFAKF